MAGTQVFTDTFSKSFDEIFVDVEPGHRRRRPVEPGDRVRLRRPAVARSPRRCCPRSGTSTAWPRPTASSGARLRILDKDGKAIGDPSAGPPTLRPQLDRRRAAQPVARRRRSAARPADDEVVLDQKSATDGRLPGRRPVRLVAGQGDTKAFTLVGVAKFGNARQLQRRVGRAVRHAARPRASWPSRASSTGSPWPATPGVSPARARRPHRRRRAAGRHRGDHRRRSSPRRTRTSSARPSAPSRRSCWSSPWSSLFVGAFIIYNTFSIIVAQRTREVALLRAIGASRGPGARLGRRSRRSSVGLVASLLGLARRHRPGHRAQAPLLDAAGSACPSTAPVISSTHDHQLDRHRRGRHRGRRRCSRPGGRPRSPPVAAMRDVAIDTSSRSLVRIADRRCS